AVVRDGVVGARQLVSGASDVVPGGRRAVHVTVKDGFQPPLGAVVDVLAAYDPAIAAGAGMTARAALVARGARVLALATPTPGTDGSALGSGNAEGTAGSGETVLVTTAPPRSDRPAAAPHLALPP